MSDLVGFTFVILLLVGYFGIRTIFMKLFERFFHIRDSLGYDFQQNYFYMERLTVFILCDFWPIGIPIFIVFSIIYWSCFFIGKKTDIVILKLFGSKKE